MPRYKLTIEYDGRHYAGWQVQPDQPTIQSRLQEALFLFCGGYPDIVCAGRTDAGVHASGQVAHVDLPRDYSPYKIMQGINFYLFGAHRDAEEARWPADISVVQVEPVDDQFHARFSALRRHYRYRIINRPARLALEDGRAWHVIEPLDAHAMQQAADRLLGHHDFTSFRDTACQANSPLRTLDHLQVVRREQEVIVTAHARSFLHHQMRIVVGTLVMVGKGRWQPENMDDILAAKDRSSAGPTAPPDGLMLTQVDYP